jgi:hypothetical protein
MDTTEAQKPAQLSELEQRHHQYDQQLSELAARPYLSAEEELEETRLKKLKLRIKDQLSHVSQTT